MYTVPVHYLWMKKYNVHFNRNSVHFIILEKIVWKRDKSTTFDKGLGCARHALYLGGCCRVKNNATMRCDNCQTASKRKSPKILLLMEITSIKFFECMISQCFHSPEIASFCNGIVIPPTYSLLRTQQQSLLQHPPVPSYFGLYKFGWLEPE